MRFRVSHNKQKISILFFLGIFLFSNILSFLLPERASALLGVGDVGSDIDITPPGTPNQQQMFHTSEKVELSIDKAIAASVLGSVVQGANYFMQKLAYDTAVYVASGGKGQGALVFSKGWGSYLESTGKAAVGKAVEELGSMWGLDFCHFPNLDLQLYLQIGIRQAPLPESKCSWNDLVRAYGDKDFWNKGFWERQGAKLEKFGERFDSSDKILKEFSKTVKVQNSDFGIALGALAQVDSIKKKAEVSASNERLEGEGFKPLTDILSGKIKTPAQTIQHETEALSAKERQEMSYTNLAGIYGSGLIEVLPAAGSMFLNTLTNQLLQKLLTQGLVSEEGDTEFANFSDMDPNYRDSAQEAKNAFGFLFTRTPTQVLDYGPLLIAQFASCPKDPGLNNCVMDTGLQDALARSSIGQSVTIAEALKAGYLNPEWPLISPNRERDNTDIEGCVSGKYCYSNIQKLRKARILPLGFEIAALRSDPDDPWTLGKVVAGFEDCRRDDPEHPEIVTFDPAKPFCHLINPNWIIKAPSARCESFVIGDALIQKDSAARKEECADISTCLQTDETGACKAFGYCTKEKNVWKIGADVCPAQYNTCTTYTNTNSKKVVSYLAKTVDYGACTIDDVGCRAYSLEKPYIPDQTNTPWKNSASIDIALKSTGRNQVVFFNEKIESASKVCNENNNGCTAFYTALREADGRYVDRNTSTRELEYTLDTNSPFAHIRKAPDSMGCYDTDPATAGNQRPSTLNQLLNGLSQNPACNNFASACISEEVGCEAFTPLNSKTRRPDGPNVRTIPGKIGTQNICAEECLGYETFKQESNELDNQKFPVYFIPSQAESCPAIANGCSEFTNIDATSRGGEGLEYYTNLKYCEKPAADKSNIKTFYSWEGSAQNGYVILTHRLKPVTAAESASIARPEFPVGSPAYVLDMANVIAEYTAACNKNVYDALLANHADIDASECKALFDDAGNTFYRLLPKTVTVDETCHPLRKTEPVFVVDNALLSAQACADKKGSWQNNTCSRCINGGKFENGFCIYQTISSPGESNSCAKEYSGCRAYSGNGVGNIQDITFDDFEPVSETQDAVLSLLNNWNRRVNDAENLRISAEATHQHLHSLEVIGNAGLAERILSTSTLKEGKWYEVSFLARGSRHSLQVSLNQGNTINSFTAEPLSIGAEWQIYHLGPIPFTGVSSTVASIKFQSIGGNRSYFIDQIKIREMIDYEYYIKDSWKKKNGGRDVPEICDSEIRDNLPGEALGCRAYQDSNDNIRFATGFERLCRENSIGCQALFDTQNTVVGEDSAQAKAFNVLCTGTENQTCRALSNGIEYGKCFIERGKTNCFIEQIVLPRGAALTPFINSLGNISLTDSSVFLPEDTASSSPIFLAIGEKSKFSCSESERGCMAVGLEQKILPSDENTSFAFTDMYIKNDPELYSETLCREDLLGCARFTAGSSETFFKDPVITGNSLCVYKEPSANQSGAYGWFLSGVGKCSNNNVLCRENSQCGEGNTCLQKDTVPCAEDNLKLGGFYDIWSNNTPEKYTGNVGLCNASYNACTEIVDTQDTSHLYPDGKPYYIIFNNKVENKKKECTQVSLNEGCVLFDKTDEPNKIFDSAKTYERSAKRVDAPYGLVDPVKNGEPDFVKADTNLLMKVNRDRECSEWLACQSYMKVGDKYLCQKLSACEGIGNARNQDCAAPVGDLDSTAEYNRAVSRLSYDRYLKRPVSWNDEEYSGYSLYNKFQITNFISLSIDPPETLKALPVFKNRQPRNYMVRELRYEVLKESGVDDALTCIAAPGENKDWKACGFGEVGFGMCYGGKCIYPIDGSFDTLVDFSAGANDDTRVSQVMNIYSKLDPQGNVCKGYPEETSPFPFAVADPAVTENSEFKKSDDDNSIVRRNISNNITGYEGVNVCQLGNCSCNYEKIIYKSGVIDYWPERVGPLVDEENNVIGKPTGICSGGHKTIEGKPCTDNSGCSYRPDPNGDVVADESGQCMFEKKKDLYQGLEGFCLEYDFSRKRAYDGSYSCLTWLPLQISASPVDIYHSDGNTGYNPAEDAGENSAGGAVMCVESSHANYGIYDINYFNQNLFDDLKEKNDGTVDDLSLRNIISLDGAVNIVGYSDALEGRYSTESSLYTAIAFDWAQSPEVSILRAEIRRDLGDNFGLVENGDEITPMWFAPDLTGKGKPELGTLMHPPRTWEKKVYPDGREDSFYNKSTYRSALAGKKVSTVAMSPEMQDGGHFVSSLESTMRRSDIAKIYLQPLSIVGIDGDFEGTAPMELIHDISIDFDYLDSNPEKPTEAYLVKDTNGPWGENAPLDVLVWTYRLTRGDPEENLDLSKYPFHDYSGATLTDDKGRAFVSQCDTDERNCPYTRYVVAYTDWSAEGNFEEHVSFHVTGGNGAAPSAEVPEHPNENGQGGHDPFSAPCNTDEASNDEFFALGLDFNRDGEFLGYISRHCTAAADFTGVQYAVLAEFKNQCVTFAQVRENSGEIPSPLGNDNKAWTNRVWSGSEYNVSQLDPTYTGVTITKDTPKSPFGSIDFNTADIHIDNQLRNYSFSSVDNSKGIPYSCRVIYMNAATRITPIIPYYAGEDPWPHSGCFGLNSFNRQGNQRREYNKETTDKLSNINTFENIIPNQDNDANDLLARSYEKQSYDAIQQLFAKVFVLKEIHYTGRTFAELARNPTGFQVKTADYSLNNTIDDSFRNSGKLLDNSFSRTSKIEGEFIMPPQIYSINPFTCLNKSTCTPAEKDNMTVNGMNGMLTDYNRDRAADEDLDFDGAPDPVIGIGGSLYVNLQFFAFADDNSMPIRSVVVDWTDGNKSGENQLGFFKNQKPVCEGNSAGGDPSVQYCKSNSTGLPTGLTCKQTSDINISCPSGQTCVSGPSLGFAYRTQRFGNTSRACDAAPFEYVHQYTCGDTEIAAAKRANVDALGNVRRITHQSMQKYYEKLKKMGLEDLDYVCVYTPRVQVTDNWGWCNGRCIREDGYDADGNAIEGASTSEGCYNEFPRMIGGVSVPDNQCDTGDNNRLINPWSTYNGKIIIIPASQ